MKEFALLVWPNIAYHFFFGQPEDLLEGLLSFAQACTRLALGTSYDSNQKSEPTLGLYYRFIPIFGPLMSIFA